MELVSATKVDFEGADRRRLATESFKMNSSSFFEGELGCLGLSITRC